LAKVQIYGFRFWSKSCGEPRNTSWI